MDETQKPPTVNVKLVGVPYGDVLDLIEALRQIDNNTNVKVLLGILRDAATKAAQNESQSRGENLKSPQEEEHELKSLDLEALHYRVKFAESLVNTLLETIEDIHETIDDSR